MGADADGNDREIVHDRLDRKIEDRLDRFSVTVLGFDRESDDLKPAVLLGWVRTKREHELQRTTRRGAVVTAIITAILGAVAWPLCLQLYRLFGPL